MTSEAQQETFGSYLKSFRLKQAETIESVARKTRIAVHCLKAIEDNDHAQLPPRAYVRSFIRAYAEAVGANADVALNLYLADLEQQAAERTQRLRRQAGLSIMRRTLLAVGLITSILVLVRFTDIFPDSQPPEDAVETSPPAADSAPAAGEHAQRQTAAAPSPKATLRLKIIAVEDTWLKIIVDGQNARSYTLKPEERLELEGSKSFNLMIGNATGVKIFLNDRPVKIFGSSGQVVSLKIP